MSKATEKLIEGLFKTKAIRVCPADSPFWYTSGKIGPYYINTHFLYGSEDKANALLSEIDIFKEDKPNCADKLINIILNNYNEDYIFKNTIDTLVEEIKEAVPLNSFDYVSGGERRDWFFSLAASKLLGKPHITVFKDMDAYIHNNGKSERISSLDGASVLHIADLITSASSYERAWVPVIRKSDGIMKHSFVIIDRMQGGDELLNSLSVNSHALVHISEDVFKGAVEKGYINKEQYNMVIRYMEDPDKFMEKFFKDNPEFIKKALGSDERTAQRAKLCLESGFCPNPKGK